jgi:uncharacterized membrane protein YfcA
VKVECVKVLHLDDRVVHLAPREFFKIASLYAPMEAAWILVVLVGSMFIGAAFGFGDALILIPFLTLIEGVSVQASVVLATYWGILLNVMNVAKYRGFLDKPFLKKTIPIGLAGTIVGSLLISIAPVATAGCTRAPRVMVFWAA